MSFQVSNLTLFAMIISSSLTGQETSSPEAVAVVFDLSGVASRITSPEMEEEAVEIFDWLPADSVIEVGESSRLTLAFADGSRYELGEKAKATIKADGPEAITGTITQLDSVPPMPRLAAISRDQHPGARSGAIRLRGRRIRNLYPRSDTWTLPESTILRYEPVESAAWYKLEIENDSGRTIFEAETNSTSLRVPSGILQPESRYYWTVKTIGGTATSVRGQSEFTTLSADTIGERAKLRESLTGEGDARSLAFLAEVDRRLGLLAEAHQGLKAALEKAPENESFLLALQKLEQQLGISPK